MIAKILENIEDVDFSKIINSSEAEEKMVEATLIRIGNDKQNNFLGLTQSEFKSNFNSITDFVKKELEKEESILKKNPSKCNQWMANKIIGLYLCSKIQPTTHFIRELGIKANKAQIIIKEEKEV
jgi:DNA polymerase II small subunit/DNA polymerase delta subunit B